MKKLYTILEAQKIGTQIIEIQAKELKKDLNKSKNKQLDIKNKEKLNYV